MKSKLELPNPEQAAADVLERSGQSRPPVDLARIAALWPGLHVSADDIDKAGYLIDLGVHGGEIVVRASDPLSRQRYTIAHELGHWVLQREGELTNQPHTAEPSGVIEDWCEHFASNVLIPRAWLLEDLRRERIAGLARAVRMAPNTYQVSLTALCKRVSKVAPISLFYLRQRGEAVTTERSYINGQISPKRIPNRIAEIVDRSSLLLPKLSQPEMHFQHSEVELRSILSLLRSRGTEERQWLLCILPWVQAMNRETPGGDELARKASTTP